MDIKIMESIVSSDATFALLFLVVLYVAYAYVKKHVEQLREENHEREESIFNLYEKQVEESRNREDRLMTHLEKTTESLENINESLKDLRSELRHVNTRVDDLWEEVKIRGKGGN
jgi:septal ring factor EnvC (AmiA/AmiB activator)